MLGLYWGKIIAVILGLYLILWLLGKASQCFGWRGPFTTRTSEVHALRARGAIAEATLSSLAQAPSLPEEDVWDQPPPQCVGPNSGEDADRVSEAALREAGVPTHQ